MFIGTVRILLWAVPHFKWLVAELPHRSRGYKASLVHVRFVLEDVIPGYVVSLALSLSFLQCHTLIYLSLKQ